MFIEKQHIGCFSCPISYHRKVFTRNFFLNLFILLGYKRLTLIRRITIKVLKGFQSPQIYVFLFKGSFTLRSLYTRKQTTRSVGYGTHNTQMTSWSCTPETCIILVVTVTPINSVKKTPQCTMKEKESEIQQMRLRITVAKLEN